MLRIRSLRAKRAESLVRKLARTSIRLQKELNQANSQKTALAKEVIHLRQQVASARQADMERLLEQHVVGALLLHEGQLKKLQQRRNRTRVEEEEKKEEDLLDGKEQLFGEEDEEDLELVCMADCQSEGRRTPTSTSAKVLIDNAQATNIDALKSTSVDVPLVANKPVASDNTSSHKSVDRNDEGKQKKDPSKEKNVLAEASPSDSGTTGKSAKANEHASKNDTSGTKDKENMVTSASRNGKLEASRSASKSLGSNSLSTSQYMPVQFHLNKGNECSRNLPLSSKGQQQPAQSSAATSTKTTPTSSNEKPSSSRSIASASSQSSRVAPTQENVGSKVFNFLFYPEKIGQQQLEQEAQVQQQQQEQMQMNNTTQKPTTAPLRPIPRKKKLNPLLQLDDFLFGSGKENEKECYGGQHKKTTVEAASVDSTSATIAATTTPASSCIDKADKVIVDSAAKVGADQQQQSPRVIPNCVTFGDDNDSVKSNLQSPSLQPSPQNSANMTRTIVDVDEVIAATITDSQRTNQSEGEKEENRGDADLYKDLKVFHTLAIPTEDEINDYHELRDQKQMLLPQRQPDLEPSKQESLC